MSIFAQYSLEYLTDARTGASCEREGGKWTYSNASEVIREALRILLARERENAWLEREAAIGFAQLDAGQTAVVDSKKTFAALLRREA